MLKTSFMKTKFTLSIDPDVIEKAKDFGRKRGKSVSHIVEEQLKSLVAGEENGHSLVKAMSGALKGKISSGVTVKDAKGKYLKAKYGL